MLKTLKFQKNYNNKLDADIFTTIRKKACGIEHGDSVAIVLNDRVYKWVSCIGHTTCLFSDLSPILLAIDTGIADTSVHALFKRFGIDSEDLNCEVDFLLLKSIPRPQEYVNPETYIQTHLFTERQ